jgi:hypothetical protein
MNQNEVMNQIHRVENTKKNIVSSKWSLLQRTLKRISWGVTKWSLL